MAQNSGRLMAEVEVQSRSEVLQVRGLRSLVEVLQVRGLRSLVEVLQVRGLRSLMFSAMILGLRVLVFSQRSIGVSPFVSGTFRNFWGISGPFFLLTFCAPFQSLCGFL